MCLAILCRPDVKELNYGFNFRTYAMIKPDAIKRAGEIIEKIERNDFVICQAKMIQLTRYGC